MNPTEFAYLHLGEFKQKGNEIVPKYCPYCHGGERNDKESFALNTENLTFNCKRSSCDKSGTFHQLCKDFGEEADRENFELVHRPKKVYKPPESTVSPATKKVEDYLRLRGFSKATWERRNVGEVGGNIAFPYFENGELVLMKFRKPEKYKGNGRKAWREEGGKPVLWGMDLCDTSKPLCICEGEYDAVALDEAGVENVVSVPSGASDLTWIETCWEWLEQFNKIILWGDNDDAGKEMVRKVILRLGEWRCAVVKSPHKDANVSLVREGKEATKRYVDQAQPVPINGLLELADVKPVDNSKIERVKTNIKMLDVSIGGLLFGELSVWTGRNGEGKSTLLSQLLLETVDQGYGVCAYSGELRADRFQYWANLQAAGKENIQTYFDDVRQADIPYLTKDTNKSIREWYRSKFFLYDNTTHPEENGILKIFTYAAKRYDCKVFLVDNLMTSRFDAASDNDFYRAQSRFVGELVHFAKAYNVHVHLVAHPRKTKEALTKEDVQGSGDITNRADNVFAVARTSERTDTDADTVISVLKNRSDGVQGKDVGLMFDKTSKRFWQQSDPTAQFKKYGWQKVKQIEIPEEQYPWD
jgi:twinkle protein